MNDRQMYFPFITNYTFREHNINSSIIDFKYYFCCFVQLYVNFKISCGQVCFVCMCECEFLYMCLNFVHKQIITLKLITIMQIYVVISVALFLNNIPVLDSLMLKYEYKV